MNTNFKINLFDKWSFRPSNTLKEATMAEDMGVDTAAEAVVVVVEATEVRKITLINISYHRSRCRDSRSCRLQCWV